MLICPFISKCRKKPSLCKTSKLVHQLRQWSFRIIVGLLETAFKDFTTTNWQITVWVTYRKIYMYRLVGFEQTEPSSKVKWFIFTIKSKKSLQFCSIHLMTLVITNGWRSMEMFYDQTLQDSVLITDTLM